MSAIVAQHARDWPGCNTTALHSQNPSVHCRLRNCRCGVHIFGRDPGLVAIPCPTAGCLTLHSAGIRNVAARPRRIEPMFVGQTQPAE
jgi:hypothetical protein